MKQYWRILSKYKWSLIFCPLLVLIFVICETLQPVLMARIVDDGVMNRDLDVITQVGITMLVVSFIGLGANIINVFVSSNASVGFATDLRSKLFSKIQTLSFTEIDKFNPASLITRLTSDITKLQMVVLLGMRLMLRSPMMLIMAFVYVMRINSELSLIVAAAIPIMAVAIYFIIKKGFPYFLHTQQKVDKLNGVVQENLINIRVVKSFVREKHESQKFSESNDELTDVSIRAANIIVTIFPVMQLVLNLSVIVVLWVGGNYVNSGGLKIGELVSLVNYLMQILMSLIMMSMIIMNIARASASSERILEVLNTEPSLTDTPQALAGNNRITGGDVLFRNAYFRYKDGETDVLQNISFEAKQGETIAVVGATGSGKSTLLQLIPRLYDVHSGMVKVSGRDVRDFLTDELHREVGMVLQKNVLFSGTIEENIRWGKEEAAFEEVMEACKAAQAHDFIISFPEGYSTVLGRGGVNVSGGQKQRICIARSIIAKPKVLILDDSTSAVDTETEKKLRSALKEFLKGTTVFVSTQRVSTMDNADKVLVLDDGKVESFGSPAELRRTSPIYQEIVNSQTLTF